MNISLPLKRKFDILEMGLLNSFSPAWMNDSGTRAMHKGQKGTEGD